MTHWADEMDRAGIGDDQPPPRTDAWALADDPAWGPLYLELVRDRGGAFHEVLTRHRAAIEAQAHTEALDVDALLRAAAEMADHMEGKHDLGGPVCIVRDHLPPLRAAILAAKR